jgi:hypothetical protein
MSSEKIGELDLIKYIISCVNTCASEAIYKDDYSFESLQLLFRLYDEVDSVDKECLKLIVED